MTKKKWICLFLSMVLLLAGCGGKEKNTGASGSQESGTESGAPGSQTQGGNTVDPAVIERMMADGIYDVELEEKKLASPIKAGETFLGAQYYNGERLWYIGNEEGQVFCYHEEQGERELLLEEVQQTRRSTLCKWRRDEEHFYILNSISLLVLNTAGEKLYEIKTEGSIRDIGLSKEGDVILVTENESRYTYVLQILNPETGTLSGNYELSDWFGIDEGAVKGVLVLDLSGVYDLDVESGEKIYYMRWSGTSYSPNMNGNPFYTFKMTEDGSMEMLQGRLVKEEYYTVSIKKINPDEMDKIPLVFRVMYANSGLKLLVARFNQQNQEYHVFLQDRSGEYYGDFVARTDMEIATGKGPDMFEDGVVSNIYALVEKGALENLEPYLTRDGIDRAAYAPETFRNLGREDGIYYAGYEMEAVTLYVKEELAGSTLEELLYNMENCDEQVVFNSLYNYTPNKLLRYFFQMSDNFYGMVDWEGKTCDFSGELWEQILRVVKRYGVTDRNRQWEEIAMPVYNGRLHGFAYDDARFMQEGKVLTGYPSEEGMTHQLLIGGLAVNAASEHKEGVWQFIQFLLEEENQKLVLQDSYLPVNEKVLQAYVDEEVSKPNGYYPLGEEVYITEDQLERFWECLNHASITPGRTEAVLAIIQEEAELYFTGDKSIEEISDIIGNRVRLYLAEQD
ncbi:MAG: extracellular solute-binding protein [Lachnospiraceae bacterium]|nr:extracellular solute-binding protein [Lachnospiraceae bacterium]